MNDSGVIIDFTEVLRIPWGGQGGLADVWVSTPQTSIYTSKEPGKMRIPARVRRMPWGKMALLANDPAYRSRKQAFVSCFSLADSSFHTIAIHPPIAAENGWHIVDFVMDETNFLYLLETVRNNTGEYSYLRCLAPDGRPVWVRSGSTSEERTMNMYLEGSPRQLLVDEYSKVYVSTVGHPRQVMGVIRDDGSLEPYAGLEDGNGDVHMDGKGRLYFTRFIPEVRKWGWVSYNPLLQEEHMYLCEDSLYGFLAIPKAVDNQGRAYGVMGMQIACASNDGFLLWQQHIENMVVDEKTGAIYTGVLNSERTEITVQKWAKSGGVEQEIVLTLPSHLIVQKGFWQLVYTDADGKFYVYGGETLEKVGILLIYTSTGVFLEEIAKTPDSHLREYHLQGTLTWSVDLDGNVYLPLLGPAYFHIIRLSPQIQAGSDSISYS